MAEWYGGPFRVIPGVDSLGQRPRPGRGDIIAHKSGAVVLRCPKCAALQFTRATVLNDPATPTLDRAIQCGSGYCKKCGIWFSIRNGQASEVEPPPPKKTTLPDKLKKAGVHEAPKPPPPPQ